MFRCRWQWQVNRLDHFTANAQHRPEQNHRFFRGHSIVKLYRNPETLAGIPGHFKRLGIRQGSLVRTSNHQLPAEECGKNSPCPTDLCCVTCIKDRN